MRIRHSPATSSLEAYRIPQSEAWFGTLWNDDNSNNAFGTVKSSTLSSNAGLKIKLTTSICLTLDQSRITLDWWQTLVSARICSVGAFKMLFVPTEPIHISYEERRPASHHTCLSETHPTLKFPNFTSIRVYLKDRYYKTEYLTAYVCWIHLLSKVFVKQAIVFLLCAIIIFVVIAATIITHY